MKEIYLRIFTCDFCSCIFGIEWSKTDSPCAIICPVCTEYVWEENDEDDMDHLSDTQVEEAVSYNKKQSYSPSTWMEIQEMVVCHADGLVGPDTVQHVAFWQYRQDIGLTIDGKVGPATLKEMGIEYIPDDEYDIRNMVKTYPHRCFGIDVSDYQGDLSAEDFQLMKDAGVVFVIFKATEGRTWKSKYFHNNIVRAKGVGLFVSAYHLTRLTDSAVTEVMNPEGGAENFVNFIGDKWSLLDFTCWNDLEYKQVEQMVNLCSAAEANDWLMRWMVRFKEMVSHKIEFYLSHRTAKLFSSYCEPFNTTEGWWAYYDSATWGDPPKMYPPNWNKWMFRQITGSGKVPGIHGDCDINYFAGDTQDFLDFITNEQRG